MLKRSSSGLLWVALTLIICAGCAAEPSVEETCKGVRSVLESAPDQLDDEARDRIANEFKRLAESAPEGFSDHLLQLGVFRSFEKSGGGAIMGDPGFNQPWDVPSTVVAKTCEL